MPIRCWRTSSRAAIRPTSFAGSPRNAVSRGSIGTCNSRPQGEPNRQDGPVAWRWPIRALDGRRPAKRQLPRNRPEPLQRPRNDRLQAGNLAVVQVEFIRRLLDEMDHATALRRHRWPAVRGPAKGTIFPKPSFPVDDGANGTLDLLAAVRKSARPPGRTIRARVPPCPGPPPGRSKNRQSTPRRGRECPAHREYDRPVKRATAATPRRMRSIQTRDMRPRRTSSAAASGPARPISRETRRSCPDREASEDVPGNRRMAISPRSRKARIRRCGAAIGQ